MVNEVETVEKKGDGSESDSYIAKLDVLDETFDMIKFTKEEFYSEVAKSDMNMSRATNLTNLANYIGHNFRDQADRNIYPVISFNIDIAEKPSAFELGE